MTCKPYHMSFNTGLRPDPLLKVSEWADCFRMLSQTASSEPGRWRTERTPYLKEIMDALSPSSPVEKVIFMKGAQIGGTEAGNNWIGRSLIKHLVLCWWFSPLLKWANGGLKGV